MTTVLTQDDFFDHLDEIDKPTALKTKINEFGQACANFGYGVHNISFHADPSCTFVTAGAYSYCYLSSLGATEASCRFGTQHHGKVSRKMLHELCKRRQRDPNSFNTRPIFSAPSAAACQQQLALLQPFCQHLPLNIALIFVSPPKTFCCACHMCACHMCACMRVYFYVHSIG